MGGKPCIRDMRVTVGTILRPRCCRTHPDEILREYLYLEAEDLAEALSYAVWRAEEVDLAAAPAVKLLVDMSLSPSWAERLASHRFEAAHWSTVVAATAQDVEILTWAKEHRFVIITKRPRRSGGPPAAQ